LAIKEHFLFQSCVSKQYFEGTVIYGTGGQISEERKKSLRKLFDVQELLKIHRSVAKNTINRKVLAHE
jgi:hypothetical protein